MLYCVEVCCRVLQGVVVCCSVVQCVAVCYSVLRCVAVCYCIIRGSIKCVAGCCSVLQCVAVCCSVLIYKIGSVKCSPVHRESEHRNTFYHRTPSITALRVQHVCQRSTVFPRKSHTLSQESPITPQKSPISRKMCRSTYRVREQ